MTRQSYQHGWVSNPIRTQRGIAFKIRYRVRTAEGKWKQRSETLHNLPGRKAARAELEQRIREASAIPAETTDLTFREFVDSHWMPHQVRNGMKLSTRAGYESTLQRHILPVLGELRLASIAPLHIENLMKDKLSSKTKLSPKTVVNLLRLVQGIFSVAVDNDLIPRSPVRRKHKPHVPQSEKTAWTPEQVKAILGEIPANYRPLFICLALTGLRAGELLGLQWKNLNLETGELRVEQSVWNNQIVAPKTKSSKASIWFGQSVDGRLCRTTKAFPPHPPGRFRILRAGWVIAQPERSPQGRALPSAGPSTRSANQRSLRLSCVPTHCWKRSGGPYGTAQIGTAAFAAQQRQHDG